MRAGEDSLHASWLDEAGGPRNWDLLVDHYGGRDAPHGLPAGVTWSIGERTPKWQGLAAALARRPDIPRDYDYIAIADDDLIVEAGAWSRAFETARAHNLPACQLSLLHASFFGEHATLRLPGLLYHHVARVEQMAIIVRADIFAKLIPWMSLPGNLFAMDHVLAHVCGDEAARLAVLDTASALHTRRFGSGAAYAHYADAAVTPMQEESAFLAAHGVPWLPQKLGSGVGLDGRVVSRIWWAPLAVLRARILRKWRRFNGLRRIAATDGETVCLLRRFSGVHLGRVDPRRIEAASGPRTDPASGSRPPAPATC